MTPGRSDGASSSEADAPEPDRRRQHLPKTVADGLRGLILSGQLGVGEFIRLEAVAAEFNVSVTPAREALLALRGDGLVELEHHRGFRVVALTQKDIRDVYHVQMEVSGELAARAALNMTPANLLLLEEKQTQLTDASLQSDVDELESLNHEFHRLINLAADSPKLSWFLGIALRYVPTTYYRSIEGWPDASVHDHEAIIRSLHGGDPSRARRAMQFHIQHASDLLIAHLDAQGFWDHRELTGRFA